MPQHRLVNYLLNGLVWMPEHIFNACKCVISAELKIEHWWESDGSNWEPGDPPPDGSTNNYNNAFPEGTRVPSALDGCTIQLAPDPDPESAELGWLLMTSAVCMPNGPQNPFFEILPSLASAYPSSPTCTWEFGARVNYAPPPRNYDYTITGTGMIGGAIHQEQTFSRYHKILDFSTVTGPPVEGGWV
jgi:hypothetical protein